MKNFSADLLARYGDANIPRLRKLWYQVFDSELHCVAVYRFGHLATLVKRRSRLLGEPMFRLYQLAYWWVTHWHSCAINHYAVIGPGLRIVHRYGIIIGDAKIGRNCVLHQNVTIGIAAVGGDRSMPTIGDNVWIGPGVTISGGITIGDGVTLSAGTVLSRDVPAGCLVAGNPGRVVAKDYDNEELYRAHGIGKLPITDS